MLYIYIFFLSMWNSTEISIIHLAVNFQLKLQTIFLENKRTYPTWSISLQTLVDINNSLDVTLVAFHEYIYIFRYIKSAWFLCGLSGQNLIKHTFLWLFHMRVYTLILKWNSNTFYDYSRNFLWWWKGGGNKCATGSFPPILRMFFFFNQF